MGYLPLRDRALLALPALRVYHAILVLLKPGYAANSPSMFSIFTCLFKQLACIRHA
jgi:hypothetical protein